MNRPRPPPIHTYSSPLSSAYEVLTSVSEDSFDNIGSLDGSEPFSDIRSLTSGSSRPHVEHRQPSPPPPPPAPAQEPSFTARPASHRTVSAPSTMSASKDFLYYEYRKDGTDWSGDATMHEIPASQAEIKKKAEGRNKAGTAMQHLSCMGPNRRAHIDKFLKIMNAKEVGGAYWEPAYINNTKTRRKDNKMEVRAFEVIFSKKQAKSKADIGIKSTLKDKPEEKEKGKSKEKEKEKIKEAEKKKEKKKEKPPIPASGIVDDAFGMREYFDQRGVLGAPDTNETTESSLPPFIPPDKPIGTLKPRIIPGLEPDQDGDIVLEEHALGGGLPLGGQLPGELGDDGLIDLEALLGGGKNKKTKERDHDSGDNRGRTGRGRRGQRRSRSRTRSKSRPRSQRREPSIIRPRSESRSRNVRFSGQYAVPQSDSSQASEDIGYVFEDEEVDELGSFTSEDTFGSFGNKKAYRAEHPDRRYHRYNTASPHSPRSPRSYGYSGDEKMVVPAKTKPRRSSLAYGIGIEQPLVKKPSARDRATVIQSAAPAHSGHATSKDVPPYAEFPDYYKIVERERERERERQREQQEREQESARRAEEYMRGAAREQMLRQREDELLDRERALQRRQEQAERDEDRRRIELLQKQIEELKYGGVAVGYTSGTVAVTHPTHSHSHSVSHPPPPPPPPHHLERRRTYDYEPRHIYGKGRHWT